MSMSTFEETQANDEQYLNRNRCSGEAYRFFTNNIGNVMSGSETETFRQPSPSVSYTTSHNALTTFNSFVNSNDFGNCEKAKAALQLPQPELSDVIFEVSKE
uniref:Uncharacterized protein n=1 Tax=Syphacia muris TaxID=451379 RepID=A0A0N5AEQ3_9BILA